MQDTGWARGSLLACLGLALACAAPGGGARAAEEAPSLGQKVQPYIACLNRLAGRALQSRTRYLSWAAKSGPAGGEKIVYGVYTLYDPADCNKSIAAANQAEPHDAPLEEAGAAFMSTLMTLTPLVKEADAYYGQSDYKDDKMAKGKEMHPKLMAAWDAFAAANDMLSDTVDRINDQVQLEELADLEKTEGRKTQYFTLALTIKAKMLLNAEAGGEDKPFNLAKVTAALEGLEGGVKDLEAYGDGHPDEKAGSIFLSSARSFLKSGKELMRRVRDKTPYSAGEKMNLSNSLSGWMVEGSPPALMHNYNELVDRFNAGPNI
jgi:Protein of unknown function (DUF3829)